MTVPTDPKFITVTLAFRPWLPAEPEAEGLLQPDLEPSDLARLGQRPIHGAAVPLFLSRGELCHDPNP